MHLTCDAGVHHLPARLRRPWTVGAVLGAAVLAWVAPRPAQAAAAPELEQIAQAYRQHYKAVWSLGVDYEERTSPVADMEFLWQEMHYAAFFPRTLSVVVQPGKCCYDTQSQIVDPGDILAYLEENHPGRFKALGHEGFFKFKYAEFKDGLPRFRTVKGDETLIYDGRAIRTKSPSTFRSRGRDERIYLIKDTSDKTQTYLNPIYPDLVMFGVSVPDLPADHALRKHDRVPDFFAGAASVSVRRERLKDREAVVVEVPNTQKVWFDPGRGYVVLRRETSIEGQLPMHLECDDFAEVVPGTWLPRRAVKTELGGLDLPKAYHGKPVLRRDFSVTLLEVNKEEHAARFLLKPLPGSLIVDQTIPPLDSQGRPMRSADPKAIPSVSYIQPADDAEVEKTIRRAQELHGEALETGEGAEAMPPPYLRLRRGLVLASAAVIGALLGFLLYRSTRKPRR